MRNPDFSERTYTVEVLRTKGDGASPFDAITKLVVDPEIVHEPSELNRSIIKVCHGFRLSADKYHRFPRIRTDADGTKLSIPRTKVVRGQELNMYDVLIAHCGKHIVVAVPFHDMAEDLFPRIDNALGGTGTRYEKLNITEMVVRLGFSGTANVMTTPAGSRIGLSVTRCHLSYVDPERRTPNVQQVRMTGGNLGASKEYELLISPVLHPESSDRTVTPVILGFALSADGVRKSSATTDRHGNFKVWIAPGLRRFLRLFDLLAALEEMKDVTSFTTNVPIMQSNSIREAED